MQINLRSYGVASYISSVDRRSHTIYIPTKNGIAIHDMPLIIDALVKLGVVSVFELMDMVTCVHNGHRCVVSCIGVQSSCPSGIWIDLAMAHIERIVGYRGVRVRDGAMENHELDFTAITFANLNSTSNATNITNNFIAQHAPHFATPNQFPLDPLNQEPVLEKAKCECGAHATFGDNCHTSNHSRWCPLYKE